MPNEISRTKSFACPSSCASDDGCTFTVVVSWNEVEIDDVAVIRDLNVKLSAKGSEKCRPFRFFLTAKDCTFDLSCTPVADEQHPIKVDGKALVEQELVDHKEKPIPGVRRSFTLDYGDPVTLAPKPPMAKPKDKEKDPNAPLTMTDAVPCSFTFSKWVSLKAFELKVSLRCRCLCASADPHALRPGDEEKSDLLIEAKGG